MNDVELTISAKGREPGSARLVLTLAVAGLIAGAALAGAYQATRPVIERNRAERLERAVLRVVPGAVGFDRLARAGDRLVPAAEAPDGAPVVYAARDADGDFLGYAIPASGSGFQDAIDLLYGYDPAARRIVGMQILQSRETPGLGDKIYKDDEFIAQFRALAVDPRLELVKGGRIADNQVDAITGATISSQAVVRIITEAQAAWDDALAAPPAGGEGGAP